MRLASALAPFLVFNAIPVSTYYKTLITLLPNNSGLGSSDTFCSLMSGDVEKYFIFITDSVSLMYVAPSMLIILTSHYPGPGQGN